MAKSAVSSLRKDLHPAPIERLLQPVDWFLSRSTAPGLLLLAAAIIGLIWANSPWNEIYHDLFDRTDFQIGLEEWNLQKPLHLWINDALMAVFFLLVGLEIKREILLGELSSPKKAAVPIAAAIGGMAVPALVYLAFNSGGAVRGWGVPMATDIAFVIGALALLGNRAPHGLRVFLVSLAIVDDLGALLVIALVYTEQVMWSYLLYAGVVMLGLYGLNVLGVRSIVPYMLLAPWLWLFVFLSGVHATISGVLLALTIPATARANIPGYLAAARTHLDAIEREARHDSAGRATPLVRERLRQLQQDGDLVMPPLHKLELELHGWVSFVVLPIFALANSGVEIGGSGGEPLLQGQGGMIFAGVALGLLIGKPLGVFGLSWLAVKTGLGTLPTGLRWRHIAGGGVLAGIGFTMALFIATLAFETEAQLNSAKIAILSASALATIIGLAVLWRGGNPTAEQEESQDIERADF